MHPKSSKVELLVEGLSTRNFLVAFDVSSRFNVVDFAVVKIMLKM